MKLQTDLLYLDNTYCFSGTAKIVTLRDGDDGQKTVILDQTIFYPQGGGQPFDLGFMENSKSRFQVNGVRFFEGIVYHIGQYSHGEFQPGEEVNLYIDQERRIRNSRLHSAGHLLDVVMAKVGYKFEPGRGYHFPKGSYVEYYGIIEPENRDLVKEQLSSAAMEMIQQNISVTSRLIEKEKLKDHCDFVPEYIPTDKPSRVVFIGNNPGCPCGGTHIQSLKELENITVYKIKGKGDKTRVSYKID